MTFFFFKPKSRLFQEILRYPQYLVLIGQSMVKAPQNSLNFAGPKVPQAAKLQCSGSVYNKGQGQWYFVE